MTVNTITIIPRLPQNLGWEHSHNHKRAHQPHHPLRVQPNKQLGSPNAHAGFIEPPENGQYIGPCKKPNFKWAHEALPTIRSRIYCRHQRKCQNKYRWIIELKKYVVNVPTYLSTCMLICSMHGKYEASYLWTFN